MLIKDHHEGYITWADYLANEAKLAANRTNTGARPPREGCALCQGIITCGSCGKPMRANYHTDQRPAYECSSRRTGSTTPTCRSVAAATVDAAVAAALLDALTPGQVALALSAAGQVTDRHQRVSRAAELAVERARYEADRAERSFHAVEPENRLVARTLEARWETKLAALAEAEQSLEAARDLLPPLPGRAELEKLAADLPALWHAPTTSSKDRKRLLRTLIADVTLLPEPDPGKARIGIRWHTGATDELIRRPAIPPGTAKRSPSPAVEMVARLGPVTAHPRAGRKAERRRADHRPRAAVRRQSRPVDPPRLQDPRAGTLRLRRDHRHRGRPPARLQHRRHLLLDRDRAASRPPRPRQPAMPQLERPHRGRVPSPHRPIRAPHPSGPPQQAPQTTAEPAGMPVPPAIVSYRPPVLARTSPHRTSNPTRDCRRGSMNHPSP